MIIDWLFNVLRPAQEYFDLYGDVTIAGEGLQNLGLCSALRAFEQGGIFIVPHLLWRRTSVFPVSSDIPPQSVASYDTHGDAEAYSNHEIEPNPLKDRAVHEGDNPSFLDEFMKFTFFLTVLLIFVFLKNNYQQCLYNMVNNYHLHPSSPRGSGLE